MCEHCDERHNEHLPFAWDGIAERRRYLLTPRKITDAWTDVLRQHLPAMRDVILSAADAEGNLDIRHRTRVLMAIGDMVQSLFARGDRRSFEEGTLIPLTPFATMLVELYARVVVERVGQAHDWMKANIPQDVFDYLQYTPSRPIELTENENPYLRKRGESDEAFRARMKDLRIFEPNPLAELDKDRQWVPMDKWQYPNDKKGYRLSDRIWQTSQSSRNKIDDLLIAGFERGSSALSLADALEAYLLPGRRGIRTLTPYGDFTPGGASYDAMRLTRTEISRTNNHAAYTSAYLNPYVNQIDVARSPNGDARCPICPRFATIGIGGGRLREPYSIHAAMLPPYHPQCMDTVLQRVADSPETVTMRLRAVMEDVSPPSPVVNPAQPEDFVGFLLQGVPRDLVQRTVQNFLF